MISSLLSIRGCISTNKSPLSFIAVGDGFGISVGPTWSQSTPLEIETIHHDNDATWTSAPYSIVDGSRASGVVHTALGSSLVVNDTFTPSQNGFTMSRIVRVLQASPHEKAFSSRFSLQQNTTSSIELFVPGVAYLDSAQYAPAGALAGDSLAAHILIREDRLPLPLAMCRDPTKSGATATLAHQPLPNHASGATFAGENFLPRIVDARLQFGSIGFLNDKVRMRTSLAYQFPGSEGGRTYIGGRHGGAPRWANRSHPLTNNLQLSHAYELRFSLISQTASYPSAVSSAWRDAFAHAAPTLPIANLDAVYNASMSLLAKVGIEYDGTPSMPFRANLPDGVVDDTSSQMGFVGKAVPAAALLLRSGIETSDPQRRAQAIAILDFWAHHAYDDSSSGQPATWYNTVPKAQWKWRADSPYMGHLRIASEGAMGALEAWTLEQQGIRSSADDQHPAWLVFARKYGDFLVEKQNTNDGSILGEWMRNGTAWSNFTNVGDVAISLLVQLWNAIGDAKYKSAALAAGEFSRKAMEQTFAYVGGACDNPNVMDKEAGVLAMEAFLALHAMSGDVKWLKAAMQAATYVETWTYVWNVPIPIDDPDVVYPASRSTLGQSLIATGQSGADNFMAIATYPFYRLYLFTNDTHWLDFARFLSASTKQVMDWDGTLGYADRGLMNEAVSLSSPRGHGVRKWLPWLTVAVLDPLVKMKEWCGGFEFRGRAEMTAKEAMRCALAGGGRERGSGVVGCS